MRRIKILTAIALFSAAPIHAWEFQRNPDRFPSVGVNIENFRESGQFTAKSSPNEPLTLIERGPAQDNYTGLGFDVRLPANDSITLIAGYTHINGDSSHSRDNNIYRESITYTGYRINLGARLYFNK